MLINRSSLSEKTRSLISQIGLNVFFKGCTIVIGFLFVPLSIKFLGESTYGVWLTLFSFFNFFNFFDFGLGHGLRNYLTPLLAKKDYILARRYISTTYISLFAISLVLLGLFFFLFDYINWYYFFDVPEGDKKSFLILVKLVFAIFLFSFTLKLINTIFFSLLKPSLPGLIHFVYMLCSYIIVYILYYFNYNTLLIYGVTILMIQFVVFLLANIIVLCFRYKELRPSFSLFDTSFSKRNFNLGGKFLILQFSSLVLYSSDNLIISRLLESSEVTKYNIAYKFFGLYTMTLSLVMSPLWSAITEAYTSKNNDWIDQIIKKSIYFVCVLAGFVLITIFIADYIYKIWVGDIEIPFLLSVFMGVYVITAMFLQVFSTYLNGIGKIKMQMIIGVVGAVVNIPLSYFLCVNMQLKSSGVILATILCNLVIFIFLMIQFIKLKKEKAYGIWLQ